MFLASVTEIRQNLGFDDMPDITEAIKAALHNAEFALSSILRTPFGRAAYSDLFFVERSDNGPSNRCDLRLQAGFVLDGTFSASVGSRPGLEDAEVVTANFVLRAEKGVATDFTRYYAREYVRCSYQAGFETSGSDPASYDLTQVPGWLQEAAKLHTLIMLDKHPAMVEGGVQQNVYEMKSTLENILERHSRYAPWAQLPL